VLVLHLQRQCSKCCSKMFCCIYFILFTCADGIKQRDVIILCCCLIGRCHGRSATCLSLLYEIRLYIIRLWWEISRQCTFSLSCSWSWRLLSWNHHENKNKCIGQKCRNIRWPCWGTITECGDGRRRLKPTWDRQTDRRTDTTADSCLTVSDVDVASCSVITSVHIV